MRPVMIAALALCGCAIVLGLTLGQKAVKMSETDVIQHFAKKYARETGGPMTACHAIPSPQLDVWMIVECGQGDAQTRYFVDVYGNQIPPSQSRPEA